MGVYLSVCWGAVDHGIWRSERNIVESVLTTFVILGSTSGSQANKTSTFFFFNPLSHILGLLWAFQLVTSLKLALPADPSAVTSQPMEWQVSVTTSDCFPGVRCCLS